MKALKAIDKMIEMGAAADPELLKKAADAHHKAIGSISGPNGVTSRADWDAVNAALGRVVASVPKQKVMDVYDAVKDITDLQLASYLLAVLAGLGWFWLAWVRNGPGRYLLEQKGQFPRDGAYSGRPNRFNRFAELQELSDEDMEEGMESVPELSMEEDTLLLDSVEVCSEIGSDTGSEQEEHSELMDSGDYEQFLLEVPWALGRGCSYYQQEFFRELFIDADHWLEQFPSSSQDIEGRDKNDQDQEEEIFHDLPFEEEHKCVDSPCRYDEEETNSIIDGFLQFGFPRGGAGGAASTGRKRQVNQLVELLQQWGETYAETPASQDDDGVTAVIRELQGRITSWGNAPPSKAEVIEHLKKVVASLSGEAAAHCEGRSVKGKTNKGSKGGAKGDKGAGGSQLHQQSFYDALRARQQEPKNGKGKGSTKKNKGKGQGLEDLPKFDVRRAFPNKALCTWQTANRALENAEKPPNELVQCRDAAQILLFQDMAKIAGIKDEIILFSSSSDNDPDIPGAKKVLLPYLGNIALCGAVVAMLSGASPGELGTSPKKMDLKTPPLKETTTLRVNAALDFIRRPLNDEILRNPALALKAAGIQNIVTEVRTFKWTTSQHRMLSGYISFETVHTDAVMGCSGVSGVFFQKLAIHASPPEVEWVTRVEGESHEVYLQRALEALDWNVRFRPTEPNGKNRPWLFYGRPKELGQTLDHSYELENGKYIRIVVHHWKKSEENELLDIKPGWWDPTAPFEVEINATVMDTQEEGTAITPTLKDSDNEKISPVKKRAKVASSFDITKPGPGQWPLRDLGGCGDCGWRVLAYGLACANTKSWKESPSDEAKFIEKAREIGAILRTQAVQDLLSRTDWEESWAKDDRATSITEDGEVASDLASFKASLGRDHRWVCGLTISALSKIKKLNVIIFEWVGGMWKRTGLVLARDSNPHKLKSAVMVLDRGHYYAVKTHQIPAEWLDPNGVVWCSKWKKYDSFFTRGGVDDSSFLTPLRSQTKRSENKPCGFSSPPSFLRTASSRKSDLDPIGIKTASSCKTIKTGRLLKSSGQKRRETSFDWKCKICGANFHGPTYASIKGKITYHLRGIHGAHYKETLEQRKADGAKTSGLGIKDMAAPRDFCQEQEDACFICPWCNDYLKGPLSNQIAVNSKIKHIKVCPKKPKSLKKVTPLQYYWMSRRCHRDFWRKRLQTSLPLAIKHEKVQNGAKQRGHNVFKTKIKMFADDKEAHKCRKIGSTWICNQCLSANLGWGAKTYYGKCPGKMIMRNPSIWVQARNQGILEKTFEDLQLPVKLQKEICEMMQYYECGKIKSLPRKKKLQSE